MGNARQSREYRDLDGILILDKPIGITSNRALQQVKKLFQARKAGHCGSLDPLASGVLPICLGQATKFSSYLLAADKIYRATCQLGKTTTTADAEGEVISSAPVKVKPGQLESLLAEFIGDIEQIPPMHSALKHKGVRLYKLARAGQEVERKPRKILIHALKLLSFSEDRMELEVHCSKGTYIRTLAEDIGMALGCGAYLAALHRTVAQPFDHSQAVSLERLQALSDQGRDHLEAELLPITAALTQFPELELTVAEGRDICQGKRVQLGQAMDAGLRRLLLPDGCFIGLGEVSVDGNLAAKRLMNTAR